MEFLNLTRASVLLAPLLALGSKSTSLSAEIHLLVQAVRLVFFCSFSALFQHVHLVTTSSMLILSLPLLEHGSKSTSISPGFYLRRPRQYDTICWELNLISGFSAFFWLTIWADGINTCGWCLAGGRGCWLKGPHQIPNVSWIFPYTSTFIRLSHL